MWTCPDCGRSFANKSQWHSCLDLSAADHLVDKTDHAIAIYDAVVSALASCGTFRVHAHEAGIAFITKMTFAGVKLAKRWLDLSMIQPAPFESSRVRKLVSYGPTSWGITIRLLQPADVDEEVRRWLGEAMRRGNQETLDSTASVDPMHGHLLDVFSSAFVGKVVTFGDELAVALPRHLGEALELADIVLARIDGIEEPAPLLRSEEKVYLRLSPQRGLGEGETFDVHLRAAR